MGCQYYHPGTWPLTRQGHSVFRSGQRPAKWPGTWSSGILHTNVTEVESVCSSESLILTVLRSCLCTLCCDMQWMQPTVCGIHFLPVLTHWPIWFLNSLNTLLFHCAVRIWAHVHCFLVWTVPLESKVRLKCLAGRLLDCIMDYLFVSTCLDLKCSCRKC